MGLHFPTQLATTPNSVGEVSELNKIFGISSFGHLKLLMLLIRNYYTIYVLRQNGVYSE